MVVEVDGGTIESIRDAVQCWILDERRCVTARRICLEFGTTRKQATEVLESIVAATTGQGGDDGDSDSAGDDRHGYEVTRCFVVVEKEEEKSHDRKTTVVKLVTNIVSWGSNDDPPPKGEGSIYSVSALTEPPPKPGGSGPPLSNCRVQAAHESDRVRERDALRGNVQEDVSGANDGGGGGIRPPSPLMGALSASSSFEAGGAGRVYDTSVTGAQSIPRAHTSSRGALAAAKRKKTTAANFFGQSSSGATKEKGGGGTSKSTKSKKGEPPTAAAKQTKVQDRPRQHNGIREAEGDADSSLSSSSRQQQQQQRKEQEKRQGVQPGRREGDSARAVSVGVAKKATSRGSASGNKNGAKNEIVGNVDDFVGDVEEDDSSDEEETMGNPKSRPNVKKNRRDSISESESERSDGDDFLSKPRSKKKNANGGRNQANANGDRKGSGTTRQKRQKKTSNSAPLSDHGDSEGEEEAQPGPTVGAMDSFVAHEARGGGDGAASLDGNGRQQQQPDGKCRRRQRKTFQERTTMDEHGYMHTETVCVMEDIPSDEEEDENDKNGVKRGSGASAYANGAKKVKKGAAPSAANNAKGKKQAGLMGFFAVKKKK